MKKAFFDAMIPLMEKNKNVHLLFGGLGWPRIDEFLQKFPDRAINTEASEQTALDICVGLAYEKKIPFFYTITPFLYRGFETIRTYISHENLPVKMVGAGRDDDYSKHDGYSHDAGDIKEILGTMKNIEQYYPETKEEMTRLLPEILSSNDPVFLSLRR